MKVSDWITAELLRRGVTTVFTLQGGYSQHLNDSIGHSALQPVYMQTEAGAAYAAYGHALYTGQMGVLVITSGLAQTNALSGVASAWSDYLPMMVISGDINSDLICNRIMNGLRQGGQQDVDIDNIATAITKEVAVLMGASDISFCFKRPWDCAMTEPRGPVWLDVPIDVQAEEVPVMTHIWWWKSRLPERKGQPCRVLARGRMNSILVEFEDGYKVVTSRFAVRRLKSIPTTCAKS